MNIERERKELETKKKKWLSEIKFSVKKMSEFLSKIKQQPFTLDMKDRKNPFYQNDTTEGINHHLQRIKEIFEEAEDEESRLIMKEEDAEENKSAHINWDVYKKAVNGE